MRSVLNGGLAVMCMFLVAYAIARCLQSSDDHDAEIPVAISTSGKISLVIERSVDASGIVDVDFGDCLFDNCFGISETIDVELVITSKVNSNMIYDLHSNSCLCVNVPHYLHFDEAGTARMQIVMAPRAAGKFTQNLSFVANGMYITIKLNGRVYSSLRLVEWNGREYQEIFQHPYPVPIAENGATKLALLQMSHQEDAVDFTLSVDDKLLSIETEEAIPVSSRSSLIGRLFPICIRSNSAPVSRIFSTKVSVMGRSESESGSISADLDFGVVVSCYPRAVYLSNKNDSFKQLELRISSPAQPVSASVSGVDGVVAEVLADGKVLLCLADIRPIGDQMGLATIKFNDDSSVVLSVFTSVE